MSVIAEAATYVAPAVGAFGAALAGAWYGGKITQRAANDAAEQDRRRRWEDDLIAVRAAARLLREQFAVALRGITGATEKGHWPREVMDSSIWDAHSGLLARLLDDNQWDVVQNGVDAGKRHADLTPTFAGPTAGKMQELESALRFARQDLEAAQDVLLRYITMGALIRSPLEPRKVESRKGRRFMRVRGRT